MEDAMIANRTRGDNPSVPAQRQPLEVLQELTRHGYVPDSERLAGGKGILLRHAAAPDLLLREDATVEVPLGQVVREAAAPAPVGTRKKRKIFWGRGLMFLVLLAFTTAFSLMILVALLSG